MSHHRTELTVGNRTFFFWQRDLEAREAETRGDDIRATLVHIDGADAELFYANNEAPWIARLCVDRAADHLRHAAELLPEDDLAAEADVLAIMCEVANDAVGFPEIGPVHQKVVALRRVVAALNVEVLS